MSILIKLREQRNAKAQEARKLRDDNTGAWTPELDAQCNAILDEVDKIDKQIETEMRLTAAMGQPADLPANAQITGGAPNGADGKCYRNLGEQLLDVRAATGRAPGTVGDIDAMQRLQNAAAGGAGTAVGSDGGFLVQSDFTTELLKLMHDAAPLAGMCRHIPIGANSNRLEAPIVDETSRATGSRWGGIQVYRTHEAGTVTATKPKFGKLQLDLEKTMGLVYVTEEGLRDAVSLTSIIQQGFSEEFAFKLTDEIVRGTGAGEPLGILNSAALIKVAKENSQGDGTIVYENVLNMWSRMYARSRANSYWIINQECEPQLYSMSMAVGTGGVPVYMSATGISGTPYATLFGRPVMPIEQASALGDVGDIMLVDMSQYLIIEKGGMQADESIHVQFLYDETAYRFITRNNGMPLWRTALTPYKGANTLSPFVALAAR
jgi:HK97 family phage major capsid protein